MPYNIIAGKIIGIANRYLDMAVCITALCAAAWLRPSCIFGFSGSKMLIPEVNSVYLIRYAFKNPAVETAKKAETLFNNIYLAPPTLPNFIETILRIAKATAILDVTAHE
jgi:hypothetical protein